MLRPLEEKSETTFLLLVLVFYFFSFLINWNTSHWFIIRLKWNLRRLVNLLNLAWKILLVYVKEFSRCRFCIIILLFCFPELCNFISINVYLEYTYLSEIVEEIWTYEYIFERDHARPSNMWQCREKTHFVDHCSF